MSDYVISCDAGNGGTNGVMALSKGRYRSVYFPSVRAAATGDVIVRYMGKGCLHKRPISEGALLW